MGSERGNNDGSEHQTLSFAEFVKRDAPKPAADRAVLILVDSGGEQQIFPITRNPTVIGRSNNSDLVLTDPAISDFHARIIKHSFGYTVEDMGSAEGTFLGDRRVSHARLVSGNTLRLGDTSLTFLSEQASRQGRPQDNAPGPGSGKKFGAGNVDAASHDPAARHPFATGQCPAHRAFARLDTRKTEEAGGE